MGDDNVLYMLGETEAKPGESDNRATRVRQQRLDIRPLRKMRSFPPYSELREVYCDGMHPVIAGLFFHHVFIVLRAPNLTSIITGLQTHAQWIIEEYDPGAGGPIPNTGAVHSMEFFWDDPRGAAELFHSGGLAALKERRAKK
jgi:hypothetical protein